MSSRTSRFRMATFPTRWAHGVATINGFQAQFFDPQPQTYTVSGAQANSDDYFYAMTRGVQQAGPTVNAAFQWLQAFGYVVAPLPMAVAQCAARGA